MDNARQPNNDTGGTLLKWGLGGLAVWGLWTLIPSSVKENTSRFLYQVSAELTDYQRRKAELEKQERIRKTLSDVYSNPLLICKTPLISTNLPTQSVVSDTSLITKEISPVGSSNTPYTKVYIEPDSIWLKRIIHPSIVLILGKRDSGKSGLSYRLLEIFRFGPKPYVVGVPASKRYLLPQWVSIASSLEEVPPGSIVIVDEAYILFHARGSSAEESRNMSKLINLSRQREQTIIFVTQESRQVDKNIASSANVIIFKEPGILQVQFERPEFNQIAVKAKEAFASITGDKRRWSYLYAPDTGFSDLIENELPSFWKPSMSRIFAGEVNEVSTTSKPRVAKKITPTEKIQKAKEMRDQGASTREIARTLGVSPGTVVNYLKNYPYRKK